MVVKVQLDFTKWINNNTIWKQGWVTRIYYCTVKSISTTTGEGFELDYKINLINLLKVHKLWNVTYQFIGISSTVDGNTPTKSYNCIIAGIKLVDIGLVYPI